MSTVMYCHKIHKNKLWQFCNKLRDFYRKNSIAYLLLQSNAKAKFITEEVVFNKEHHISLQLFDKDDNFIFRVISADYLFLNNWIDFDNIQPLFYDDRTDVPPEHKVNKAISEWIDNRVAAQQYFIVPIVDEHSLLSAFFEIAKGRANE